MASDHWADVKLGDVVEIRHGWAFKSEFFSEDLRGSPIVVAVGNFRYEGGFRFDSTKVKEYRGDYPQEFELSPGDILLIMTCQTPNGEILGIPARIPGDGRTYLHNQRLGKVAVRSPKQASEDFLYWLFRWRQFNNHLFLTASGTKILYTAPDRIEPFRFHLPPLKEQKAIAHILGTLDDKIELNRRMNATLEAMARALFKSWFVDFEPVRAKAEGRDTGLPTEIADFFPGRFQDSELGAIPEGWKVGSLLDQSQLLSGGTPRTDHPEYWDGQVQWVSAKDVSQCNQSLIISTERTITELGLKKSATRIVPAFSTIVVARGATTGRMAMLGLDMAMNQTCYALRSSLGCNFTLYCLTRQVMEDLVHRAHGSIFNTITTNTFQTSRFVLAPSNTLRQFENIVEPMFRQILANSDESRTLASIRDAMLPKLLSGEIPIKDSEKFVERGTL